MRRNCLIIAIACFLLAMAISARAETRIAAIATTSDGLGYEDGFGGFAEQRVRIHKLMLVGSGSYINQKKNNADSGYTWRLTGKLRWYPKELWFVSAGYTHGGYESEFSSGSKWKKDGGAPIIGIGIDGRQWEFGVNYQLKDNSPNNVSAFGGTVEYTFEPIFIRLDAKQAFFDQGNDRESGTAVSIIGGIKF